LVFQVVEMASSLPSNVHISKHPCLRAKLSQLRSKRTNARETKTLVHEIALLLGSEALAQLDVYEAGRVSLPAHPLMRIRAD
jgi:uracil phosphoribosyltransferase